MSNLDFLAWTAGARRDAESVAEEIAHAYDVPVVIRKADGEGWDILRGES